LRRTDLRGLQSSRSIGRRTIIPYYIRDVRDEDVFGGSLSAGFLPPPSASTISGGTTMPVLLPL
jgi:hypothetical protein